MGRGTETKHKTETDLGSRVGKAQATHSAGSEKETQTKMAAGTRQHDLELKELEALRFSAQAARAVTTLEVRRKAVTRIYGERIKRLKAVILLIQQKDQLGQLKIDGMDSIEIEPELKKLVFDPVGDLS